MFLSLYVKYATQNYLSSHLVTYLCFDKQRN